MNSYYLYICQGAYGICAISADPGFEWPGDSPQDAVRRLNSRYPYYSGDLFIAIEVGDLGVSSRNATAIRVDAHGNAAEEFLGR